MIQAVVDPNEPPMPPKATMKQTLHLAESLVRGTPDRRRIVELIFEDKLKEMI